MKRLLVILLLCGIARAGVNFDAVDDEINCGSDASLDNLVTYTITAWIYPRTLGEGSLGRVYGKETTNSGPLLIMVSSYNVANNLILQHNRATVDGAWRTPTNAITLNAWQHVAVTYDGSSTANNPAIYINGTSQTVTTLFTPSGALISDAAASARIGNTADGSCTFDGFISDVRVYNRVLSANEISGIASSKLKYNSNTTGLIAYWPMDDRADGSSGDAQTFRDRAGINNGTGADGANNTGLTGTAESVLSYP